MCSSDLIAGNVDSPRPSSPTTNPCSPTIDQGRPFTHALRALKHATASIGQPHAGVSDAVETARTSSTTALSPSGSHARRRSQQTTLSTIKRSEKEIPARCRVGLDLIGLLVGSGGHDAVGREVGVGPGESVEAAVLSNASQVTRVSFRTATSWRP